MCDHIAEAIRYLYVITGRALTFSDDMFIKEDDLFVSFTETLALDEQEYVLVTSEIDFFKKVQSNVSDLTSYTTDAMSVSHGDKPFANLQQKIEDLVSIQNKIWYKMIRYHLL